MTSLTQQLAAFLKARPHQWIGAREFEQFGRQSWRTRLSECRKAPHFMNIENRVTIREWKGTLPMGQSRHWKQSEYRYVPSQHVNSGSVDSVLTLTSDQIGVD